MRVSGSNGAVTSMTADPEPIDYRPRFFSVEPLQIAHDPILPAPDRQPNPIGLPRTALVPGWSVLLGFQGRDQDLCDTGVLV